MLGLIEGRKRGKEFMKFGFRDVVWKHPEICREFCEFLKIDQSGFLSIGKEIRDDGLMNDPKKGDHLGVFQDVHELVDLLIADASFEGDVVVKGENNL